MVGPSSSRGRKRMTTIGPRPDVVNFSLAGRVAVITGGSGLLGGRHAEAIAAVGGIPVLADIEGDEAGRRAEVIEQKYGVSALGLHCDVTSAASVEALLDAVMQRLGRVDVLVNNAANNPKVEAPKAAFARLETFTLQ